MPVRSVSRKTLLSALLLAAGVPTAHADDAASRLTAALLGDTPLVSDLRVLTDEIGGRPTGSEANRRAVEWGLERFREAGLAARKEPFPMPMAWLETSSTARVSGDAGFEPRVVANPFSVATPPTGVAAPLVSAREGSEADFERLGPAADGAFLLVSTRELLDVEGLFREYMDAAAIEARAVAAGARGIVWMSSRPGGLLYRHNAARGPDNTLLLLTMAREDAQRAARLLDQGRRLQLTARIGVEGGKPYTTDNVIAEIRGRERPEQVVIVGAHLDSWDLGTGALDNGCNVALVIDVARQMKRLGLQPRRTVRFALWNGEEQGLHGSWEYVKAHRAELDDHVMAASFDIGTGRINGFFTNGRPELIAAVERSLAPLAGLGPFVQSDEAMTGTDHYDFLVEGVAALVANQDSANYGPNYHAASDTFDKVDARLLRTNAAVAAALTWGFAEGEVSWGRLSGAEVERIVETPGLKSQMQAFGLYESYRAGRRGRRP
jgi:hypothetical protein